MTSMLTMDKDAVLIIIPVYNESKRVGQVIESVIDLGFKNILVVDDGSIDQTQKELKKHPVMVLSHIINRGVGAATETGLEFFRRSRQYLLAVTIDGDMQHSPEDIEHMISQHMEQNAELTMGNRFLQKSNSIPWTRKLYNLIADIVTSIMSMSIVRDSQSGFKVWSRQAAVLIHIDQNGYEFCSEVAIKAHQHKLKIIQVPISVTYNKDVKGKGQNLKEGVKTFFNLIHHFIFKH